MLGGQQLFTEEDKKQQTDKTVRWDNHLGGIKTVSDPQPDAFRNLQDDLIVHFSAGISTPRGK